MHIHGGVRKGGSWRWQRRRPITFVYHQDEKDAHQIPHVAVGEDLITSFRSALPTVRCLTRTTDCSSSCATSTATRRVVAHASSGSIVLSMSAHCQLAYTSLPRSKAVKRTKARMKVIETNRGYLGALRLRSAANARLLTRRHGGRARSQAEGYCS